ncbi:mandelate racemase/muconate lactonizing enzyme family protein [Mastigocoleus testarum]|uniref:Mandelate racemase/muconate lactonizing enzyme C-terminal domain-containing protein n=1 Tax=Mastigocoleus testarum BC008 TaxID=371196 RepID=A0A0V7ZTD0_9CYAN|nr:mandelate racemase/muconate lactonizing enzyme family protein [Mastigocoleus testarum]KST67924.1 hypothetical protein BC008_31575 [Mastigocoleus testarum BC008]
MNQVLEIAPILTEKIFTSPVKIAKIELLKLDYRIGDREIYFVRSVSSDGAVGITIAHKYKYVQNFYPILQNLVIPYFIGKDARKLESLIDGVYLFRRNYKLGGLPFWCCVAWVEMSLLDLLGKVAGKSVGQILGGVLRPEIPIYLSSLRRDTTPEKEVAFAQKRIEKTGAKAIKFKIGGRMSNNVDAAPGRTKNLISLARKTLGDSIAIHADANGSYDAKTAIEVGRMLEAHNVSFFEEPCPFEELEEIKHVADVLSMSVAAGELETSWSRFKSMIRQRTIDIAQPDLIFYGGFIRTIRVARQAEKAGIFTTIHNPERGPGINYPLHCASCIPNPYKYHEYNAKSLKETDWFAPVLKPENGVIKVPQEPGLGMSFDPKILREAKAFL